MAAKFQHILTILEQNMICGHFLKLIFWAESSYLLPIANLTSPHLNFKMASMEAILIFKMAAVGF